MPAAGFPDANDDKVSDGNSLFPITAEWEEKKDYFFFCHKGKSYPV